jgi:hypothetical protein
MDLSLQVGSLALGDQILRDRGRGPLSEGSPRSSTYSLGERPREGAVPESQKATISRGLLSSSRLSFSLAALRAGEVVESGRRRVRVQSAPRPEMRPPVQVRGAARDTIFTSLNPPGPLGETLSRETSLRTTPPEEWMSSARRWRRAGKAPGTVKAPSVDWASELTRLRDARRSKEVVAEREGSSAAHELIARREELTKLSSTIWCMRLSG